MSAQSSIDRGPENTWEGLDEGVKKAVISLRDFARQREKDFQYVISLSPSELGSFLSQFYSSVKDQPLSSTDEEGSAGVIPLQRIRCDLREYFKKVMSIDISSGGDFLECNSIVDDHPSNKQSPTVSQPAKETSTGSKNAVMKKHTRQRTFTFETNELRQIYMSEAMNLDQPETLQNKVFFDVCMYICNRGKDFLRLMTKSDFEVSTDQSGRRYVWLKFDPKFSFNEVAGGTSADASRGTQIGERMYERPGDPKCPVLSYTQYTIHLHPMSDAFWQRPKRNILPTDIVWFDNQSIGNSTLNRLMNRITSSAGLPDSYAINAIKPSYIPIIESICRSALFGSQQFRRILHMKQSNHDMHYVRKRHSEGSLSIASVLRESPLFRPRHSEPQLPLYRPLSQDTDIARSCSSSPVTRAGSWDSGSPHMMPHKTPERIETPETGYQQYRNCEPELTQAGYQQKYREVNGAQDLSSSSQASSNNHQYHEEEGRKIIETGTIMQAKQKCLDIVHSLEVRDIKSFVAWMKTFEVKHGSSGLMVTCQPVSVGESQQPQDVARATEQNHVNGFRENLWEQSQRTDTQKSREFTAKDIEFDCIGDTFCCTSDIAPLKVTIPAQDTLLLTGVQSDTQVLIHKKHDEKQSPLDEKYSPLHQRVLISKDSYSLQEVNRVLVKRNSSEWSQFQENVNNIQESGRPNFKEDKSIPMKKRIVLDQESQNVSGSHSNSPQQSYANSRSPPQPTFSQHTNTSAPHGYMSPPGFSHPGQLPVNMTTGKAPAINQAPPPMTQAHSYPVVTGSNQMHSGISQGIPSVPKYRERFPEGWGYFPLQKRQKFGIQSNGNDNERPLELIKQS
ncbi:hypothetical protein MAR_017640 [Mya arenaria]|uniref:Uncharacterized protein n=1 Tax=Mya arenaria TaxID=6604 RepID=A0ABY7EFI8_MYAAR|nr:uncharacterized protein LOC128237468 [Mya arenaria]WAR07682.1 hypothetical protein MAR_017640 [Mya arenaria]